jgi:hypothetical protein
MKTLNQNIQTIVDNANNWPQTISANGESPITGNNWQSVWQDFSAFLLTSVLSFTQSEQQRKAVLEVITLCEKHSKNKGAWIRVAFMAAVAANNCKSTADVDEESRLATLTAWAVAQAIITNDTSWAERAIAAAIASTEEGYAAFAFGCSKTTVAKIGHQRAVEGLSVKFAELVASTTATSISVSSPPQAMVA